MGSVKAIMTFLAVVSMAIHLAAVVTPAWAKSQDFIARRFYVETSRGLWSKCVQSECEPYDTQDSNEIGNQQWFRFNIAMQLLGACFYAATIVLTVLYMCTKKVPEVRATRSIALIAMSGFCCTITGDYVFCYTIPNARDVNYSFFLGIASSVIQALIMLFAGVINQ